MLHPSQYFTEDQLRHERDYIQASLKDRRVREIENQSTPPAVFVPIVCETAAEMRNYRERFLLGTNHPQRLADATAREWELEQKIAGYNSTVARCRDPKSTLKRSDRALTLEKILGKDFPSAATRLHDHPTMIHQDGLLDQATRELTELRQRMPILVRAAERYLEEFKNVPTEAAILAARRREQEVENLTR